MTISRLLHLANEAAANGRDHIVVTRKDIERMDSKLGPQAARRCLLAPNTVTSIFGVRIEVTD